MTLEERRCPDSNMAAWLTPRRLLETQNAGTDHRPIDWFVDFRSSFRTPIFGKPFASTRINPDFSCEPQEFVFRETVLIPSESRRVKHIETYLLYSGDYVPRTQTRNVVSHHNLKIQFVLILNETIGHVFAPRHDIIRRGNRSTRHPVCRSKMLTHSVSSGP